MDEAQVRAEIEAKVRAEIEAELRGKQAMDAALRAAQASAGRVANMGVLREDYGAAPSDNARIYGAVLAAQMLAGDPGTPLNADGYGGPDA